MKTNRKPADRDSYRIACEDAIRDLDGLVLAEYGLSAVTDTAGMFLYDAGYDIDRDLLREVAREVL